ncbi:hypothetical protein AUJ83_01650 [Candidatus Woesearchaeota archaeon CG1_02_33_12]|nr:MAG: hypothetical protein AUJ83_01650 [Candidatus Woesearchaeota archaeon CG1_02_33_12]
MKLTDREKFLKVYNCFANNGYTVPDGEDIGEERVKLQDLITTEDIAPFIPKVIKRIIVEAVEPALLIIPNLFTEVNLPEGQMIEIGAISAIVAGKVPQGGDYPTSVLATDTVGATVQITVAKYGCAINVASEVVKDNQFDVIKLWLRAAGAALARLKESQAIRLIDEMGITVFDNADPSNSESGVATGRGIDGAQNGTMTLNDVFDLWAYLALRGFTPDTLIMSPLAWKVFSVDPQLREIVLNGAVLATRRMPLGHGAPGWEDIFKGLGLKGTGTGTSTEFSPWTQTMTPQQSTYNIPAKYLPTPLRVLVTHLMPFTERTGLKPITDIALADSQRCGILVQRENPTTEEADIFTNDTHVVKIFERYGMNMFDQGKGVAVARNIIIDYNYVFDNVNSRTLNVLDTGTALV